jgi:hypothetical protein
MVACCVRQSMRIAADLCVFTNKNFTIECFEDGELVSVPATQQLDALRQSDAEAELPAGMSSSAPQQASPCAVGLCSYLCLLVQHR